MVGSLRTMHLAVLHRLRRLAFEVEEPGKNLDASSQLALQICTECRKLISRFYELDDNHLHCCFKVFVPQPDEEGKSGDSVETWVRSEPFDDRPAETGDGFPHYVTDNTVWSALLGEYDGNYNWRVFRCFACNDLTAYPKDFRCDRQNWQRYYRSTVVVPIRYPLDIHGQEYKYWGFLAFDSPRTKAFPDLPDIFAYRDDPHAYSDLLEKSAAFHLIGILADIMGTFLRNVETTRGA
ncbi:MAG: hypothetical protein DWQ31_04645 [Planctomycetota bacterium]|nr:MAG: hypothetical protein DWQ31_04645 [Planctomycetota bacterium]REJ97118.1 MAG: hypothetical protein DWQ35_02560 [Planctomycetota bacterium]REK22502.1 MAG: hypothetical protein DWQ42_17075 [Planctomycetota bacterium]REK47144.1 MAG: hypothetical protein DWQ46_05060 [Planctomycetota bacterium]